MANEAVIKHRKSLEMNQKDYWERIGVTQSAGSRYENRHDMPEPTQRLWNLVYGKKPLASLAKLRGCTVEELKA